VTVYTIGFTKKSAEEFFEALRRSGARHLLDIRLHNTSQLAGFTKRNDLRYFLRQIVNMEYHEVPILAPEDSFLSEYRRTGDWAKFEQSYLELIRQRQVERHIDPALFEGGGVLLCSEAEPNHCHRRLAAEYLTRSILTGANIEHL
jgi:uncharacterized protein (DUF488 family)